MSPLILCIESSTDVCSVALFEGKRLRAFSESTEVNRHAELLAVLIDDLMKIEGVAFKDLSAVAVGIGPGSYTSLRVGLSTAKGICFGCDIPIIALPGDHILIRGNKSDALHIKADYIISMVDARRMEAYCTTYSIADNQYSEAIPVVFDKDSFDEIARQGGKIAVCGNGAKKWCDFIENEKYVLLSQKTSATYMGELAFEKFESGEFEDLARVSPEYIKPPNITLSKKKFGLL